MIASQVETIVREVIRRLQADQARAPELDDLGQSSQSMPGELSIADRLVTLEVLDGKLSGIGRVLVSPRAVITPAARDELRGQGIQIVPTTTAANSEVALQAGDEPLFAACGTNLDIRLLAGHHAARIVTSASTEGGLRHFAGLVSGGGRHQRGVVFTDKPNRALHRLCGLRGVRSFWAPDSAAIREGRDDLDANVMVISPERHDGVTIQRLVSEFLDSNEKTS